MRPSMSPGRRMLPPTGRHVTRVWLLVACRRFERAWTERQARRTSAPKGPLPPPPGSWPASAESRSCASSKPPRWKGCSDEEVSILHLLGGSPRCGDRLLLRSAEAKPGKRNRDEHPRGHHYVSDVESPDRGARSHLARKIGLAPRHAFGRSGGPREATHHAQGPTRQRGRLRGRGRGQAPFRDQGG